MQISSELFLLFPISKVFCFTICSFLFLSNILLSNSKCLIYAFCSFILGEAHKCFFPEMLDLSNLIIFNLLFRSLSKLLFGIILSFAFSFLILILLLFKLNFFSNFILSIGLLDSKFFFS